MPEPANTSPSQTSQSQQSSPLPEAQETQETPKTQGSQPTHEPSAHQEEQPLAKPKITREEIAQRPLNKRAVITIGAAFLITFAFDRLICSIPPTWLIGYELPVFWIICASGNGDDCWDCEVCDGEVLAGSGMIMIPF